MGVLPNNFRGSTTFNNSISSYDMLALRVKRLLGYPLIQIEIADEQLYEIMNIACEYFTKFAGMTEEFLIFRSDLYIPGVGLPIGRLINISPDLATSYDNLSPLIPNNQTATEYDSLIGDAINHTFIVNHNLNSDTVYPTVYDAASNQLVITGSSVIDANNIRINFSFVPSVNQYKVVVLNGKTTSEISPTLSLSSIPAGSHGFTGIDFDLNDYRKVVDVSSFIEGSNTGINTLFTIEHAIAQQAYFGHLLGNVGYDLVTWQALKGWIDLREKTLALTPYLRFYPEDQILKIIPEPTQNSVYFGLVKCKLQKPIKHIVSQLWVYKYVTALTKIAVAHARGKYTGAALFGGQTINYTDLMSQGLAERDKLEAEITSDLIDREPIPFFIG